jgi:preprotein translocase subunit SecE
MNPITYIRQVREELGRVTWPTRQSTINMTAMVIGVSAVVGIYIGGLDSLFTSLLNILVRR